MMSELVNLPQVTITKDLIERIRFSLSSRNAEYKVAECAVHIFASKFSETVQEVKWQYVTSGVPCMLRNRELHKNGRKYVWGMNLCLCNAQFGVLVWKSKLAQNCEYTPVADNFHVFALSEVNVIVGILFTSKEQACEMNTVYTTWNQERQRDDGKKGPTSTPSIQPARFSKEMISKPCNFQHIQGTQALDECLQIEKIKADIIASLFGLGTTVGRSEADSLPQKRQKQSKQRGKHEITQPKMSFNMINVPRTSMNTPPTSPPPLSPPPIETVTAHEELHSVQFQATVEVTNGYDDTNTAGQENHTTAEAAFVPATDDSIVTTNFAEPAWCMSTEAANYSQNSQPEVFNASGTLGDYDSLEPAPVSQGSYGYNQSPPRLDLNLEKEFTDSVLFQSPLMTAN